MSEVVTFLSVIRSSWQSLLLVSLFLVASIEREEKDLILVGLQRAVVVCPWLFVLLLNSSILYVVTAGFLFQVLTRESLDSWRVKVISRSLEDGNDAYPVYIKSPIFTQNILRACTALISSTSICWVYRSSQATTKRFMWFIPPGCVFCWQYILTGPSPPCKKSCISQWLEEFCWQ